jgi:hypothetical protein
MRRASILGLRRSNSWYRPHGLGRGRGFRRNTRVRFWAAGGGGAGARGGGTGAPALELVLVVVAFIVVVIAIVVAGAFDLLAEVESIGATPDDPAPAPTTPSPELPFNGGHIDSPFMFTPLPPPHHDHPLSRECDPS